MKEVVRKNHALKILSGYEFNEPFSFHLRKYFSAHKQIGSGDRRFLRNLTYNHFRLGKAGLHFSPEKTMLLGNLMAEKEANSFLAFWFPEVLNIQPEVVSLPVEEKWSLISDQFGLTQQMVFPFMDEISDQLDRESYFYSLFRQPPVYIRIKKGYEDLVLEELKKSGIGFQNREGNSWEIERDKNLQNLSSFSKGYFEIQDLHSARVTEMIPFDSGQTWWDCCSGSGGKSLAAADRVSGLRIIASDKRKNILQNLRTRFKRNNISFEKIFVADLEVEKPAKIPPVDGIMLDAPCSGSGTWARTPENISTFTTEKLDEFTKLQEKILHNLKNTMVEGNILAYITCSVLKKENEEIIKTYNTENDFEIIMMEYLKGYEKNAETLFITLLRKK